VEPKDVEADLAHVLLTEEQVLARIKEVAQQIDQDYARARTPYWLEY
jgi:hypoxanthine-guanine phosphoribosyltransferase